MNLAEVRQRAKTMGLRTSHISKKDLIRSIQAREGNDACYQTKRASCEQLQCCWWSDCMGKGGNS